MARPSSRRRRRRSEPEPDPREEKRGRRGAAAKKAGPAPATIIMGGVIVVLLGVVGIVAVTGNSDKKKDTKEKVVLNQKPVEEPTGPTGPEPPKPLTAAERAEVEKLFADAAPHMDAFRGQAAKGWRKKEAGDNKAANDCWVIAKKEFQKAIGIVSEVMEDEDRFSFERQKKYMRRYLDKMNGWQKEWSQIPKVNTVE